MNTEMKAGERFFITMARGAQREKYFPPDCIAALETMGDVGYNPFDRKLTEEELAEYAAGTTVLLTHWGTPQIGETFLAAAPELKMIAHCAGTVAHIASEETYRRSILCLSANDVMARYVAEDVLGLMIAGLRGFKEYDLQLQAGIWKKDLPCASLLDGTVGLIGLGTVGRKLLDLLTPFRPAVKVYDPYLAPGVLDAWDFAEAASFDGVLSCDVVSVHASQTPETYHMIDAGAFEKMKDGAVFINTSRGSLVDTAAAEKALRGGRLRAAFDVFEREGRAQEALSGMDHVLIQPHLAALPAGARMTREIIGDIRRVLDGEAPRYAVPYAQFLHMTQE